MFRAYFYSHEVIYHYINKITKIKREMYDKQIYITKITTYNFSEVEDHINFSEVEDQIPRTNLHLIQLKRSKSKK